MSHPSAVGIVVIGQNEADNLTDALGSLPAQATVVVYVDSGSTDDSVRIASGLGVHVLELDRSVPFSAARARREGVETLLAEFEAVRYIQFLDGDCSLEQVWIQAAVAFLDSNPDVGIVCGLLKERYPERSVYNRFNAARWRSVQTGDVSASGGIFLARLQAYQDAGGFRAELLTGEEADLCARVRQAGYRIVRLPIAMADHDSGLVGFRDWWTRAVWGGRGDAIQVDVLANTLSNQQCKEIRSVFVWVAVVPTVALAGAILATWDTRFLWLSGLAAVGSVTLVARIIRAQLRGGERLVDAIVYAVYAVLRKLPYALGYFRERFRRARSPRPGRAMSSAE
ncbi:glycosyltransferase family 2 protein [Thioalkalivibrio sp. XN279]|uniref:glycosyltransferase family 2 protein n=1 Tax=Thioalkalivibrio sp. XN279 TaxID=2714953 RepID=UPI00140C2FC2|nr:glycosyltransferase [Thioalkalivibrio sp. XN279]NHA15354.1 glycosyltransferase family 2 protein [Thioalkalivibrio sp. XN279]